MTYYILGKGEPLEHLAYSTNILGEESFGYFYWEDGYKAMLNIINSSDQQIDDFNIFDGAQTGWMTGRRPVTGQLYPRGVFNK